MKTNLKNIATVHTGVFAQTESEGEIVYLQAKHFNDKGQLNSALHADLKPDNVSFKHLLKPGDVLYAAKGSKNFAAIYESKNPPAVASTSFFVIRLVAAPPKHVMPEYLVWFLNHPRSQKIIKGGAIGSSIVSISKRVLDEIEITIPDLQSQKTILKLSELRIREAQLKREIETLREKQIQQQLLNALNK